MDGVLIVLDHSRQFDLPEKQHAGLCNDQCPVRRLSKGNVGFVLQDREVCLRVMLGLFCEIVRSV